VEASAPPKPADSVFRAFAEPHFRKSRSWFRLESYLATNGGCYGIAGPRGVGKSWHMLLAVERVREQGGIGVWFPSPSEYDPHSFLSALADNFANQIERRWPIVSGRARAPVKTKVLRLSGVILLTLALAVVASGLSVSAREAVQVPLIGGTRALWPVILLIAAVGGGYWIAAKRWTRSATKAEADLVDEARILRERIRFTTTQRQGVQVGATAGYRGFTGRFTRSKERELAERPTTVSSLIHDFRALAEHAGEVTGAVVVAIDELDKMDDAAGVRSLLRDIKGIFEVPHVHFLVSVSDEAARTLQLGALIERNEFNSSFYTVIAIPTLSMDECVGLLTERGMKADPRLLTALGVLSAGNPRELLRIADLATQGLASTQDASPSLVAALAPVMKAEAAEFQRDLLSISSHLLLANDDDKASAYFALDEPNFLLEKFVPFARGLIKEEWSPSWGGSTQNGGLRDEWRKLLVRLYISGLLASEEEGLYTDSTLLADLQRIVAATPRSPGVARLMLANRCDRGLVSERST